MKYFCVNSERKGTCELAGGEFLEIANISEEYAKGKRTVKVYWFRI